MAFPWLIAENFELGTKGSFDTETDTVSQLDVVGYKELSRYPWPGCAPFSGAYAARVQLTGGTADAYYTETSVDIADAGTAYFRFALYFSPTFTATADDVFSILELWGAASAITGSVGVQITASTGVIQLGIGSAASAAVPATFAAVPIQRDTWYTVELKFVCQTNGTGSANLYITRAGDPAQLTADASLSSKTNIVVTDGVIGCQDHLATTTGVILIDDFVMDDTRVYPANRYPNDPVMTASGHAFVGPGWISGAAILSGTSPVMTLFDTDTADVTSSQSYTDYFDSSNQTSVGGHIFFQRGCYVQLSGTNPVGQVMFVRNDANPGVFGPLYYNDPGVRRLGSGS